MDSGLAEWLKGHGCNFTPDLSILPDKPIPIDIEDFKGWYSFWRRGEGIYFMLGNWRTGDKFSYQTPDVEFDFTDPEYIKLQERAAAARESGQEDARIRALAAINRSGQNMITQYLERKNVQASQSMYQELNAFGEVNLLVPMHDIDGNVWNVQTIEPYGTKSFLSGGRTKGLMHAINHTAPSTNFIYICEGVATALSVSDMLAGAAPVFIAFAASNLREVGELIRAKFPGSHLMFCADNDHLREINVGLKSATDAALAVHGLVIYPRFTIEQPGSDWNDYVSLVGRDNAKKEFQRQLDNPNLLQHLVETNYGKEIKAKKKRAPKKASTETAESVENAQGDFRDEKPSESASNELPEILRSESGLSSGSIGAGAATESHEEKDLSPYSMSLRPYINGLLPMKMKTNKKGDPVIPLELDVAHYVLSYYKDKLRRFDSDLFLYTGTHWKLLSSNELVALRTQIIVALNGLCTANKINSVYRILFDLCKTLPRNPFVVSAKKISFKNGTLHVEQAPQSREWSLRFSTHAASDFISHFIPYDFNEKATNPAFLGMLDNIFASDPDRERKLMLIQEMYGACIAPVFPHLFLLYGPGGSGKSSVIICAGRLVHQDAQCSVEPSDMEGFKVEAMAGRLVNVVTDIDVLKPIHDAIVKRITDQTDVRIDRKYRSAIMAPLPAVHIFGANSIPATRDLTSDAMLRRWSIVHLANMKRAENPDEGYANWAFDQCPEGVLAWALVGLRRLLANRGIFTQFEAERNTVKEWQSGRDSVQQFLNDLRDNEVPGFRLKIDAKVIRKTLWNAYVSWCKDALSGSPKMGRNTFFAAIESKGRPLKLLDGVRYFGGIEADSEKEA